MLKQCIVVLVGPSGIGKTSNAILLRDRFGFARSITITTAPPCDDNDEECYQYVDRKTFEEMIGRGDLLEWDTYRENYYGASRESLTALNRTDCPGMVICSSPKGYPQIRDAAKDVIGITLLPEPGDFSFLKKKPLNRGTNRPDEIDARMRVLEKFMEETRGLNLPTVYLGNEPETWERAFTEIIKIIRSAGFLMAV
jgi:guanylate kinase